MSDSTVDRRIQASLTELREIRASLRQAVNFEADSQNQLETKQKQDNNMNMDAEIRRLEDRIEASNREFQFKLDASNAAAQGRLDIALNKIDGNFQLIRIDMSAISASLGETKSLSRETKNTVIVTSIGAVFAILFGVLSAMIGLKQVWIGGVQVGQSDHSNEMSSFDPNKPYTVIPDQNKANH